MWWGDRCSGGDSAGTSDRRVLYIIYFILPILLFFYIYYFMSHQSLGLLATSEEAGLYIIVKRGMFQIE